MRAIRPATTRTSLLYLLTLLLSVCIAANAQAQQPSSRHKPAAGKPAASAKQARKPGKIITRQNLRKPQEKKVPVAMRRSSAPAATAHEGPHAAAQLRSETAFAIDLNSSTVLFDKNSNEIRPIASISKLMTALIVAESGLPMNETLTISDEDVDRLRHSRSRLAVGTRLSRADMLHLALMSSENRAAHALGRYYPGGMPAFVRAMNDKARSLGMRSTHFVEPTGLSANNVSTARDLAKLLRAVSKQPLIHRYTTDDKYEIALGSGRQLVYNNTNGLVRNEAWDIKISKTGFINEAGECLVMITRIDNRDVAMVFLNSTGRYSRIGDAVRMRSIVENSPRLALL